MTQEDIQNSFEETNIEYVGIPKKCYSKKGQTEEHSYQHLSTVLSMGNIEFFTLTVLIGKFVVKETKEFDGGVEQFFKMTKANRIKDEMTILKSIAVNEVDNPLILKDYESMREIWVGYSYAGFEKLFKWYEKGVPEMEKQLSELMISNFEEHKE